MLSDRDLRQAAYRSSNRLCVQLTFLRRQKTWLKTNFGGEPQRRSSIHTFTGPPAALHHRSVL